MRCAYIKRLRRSLALILALTMMTGLVTVSTIADEPVLIYTAAELEGAFDGTGLSRERLIRLSGDINGALELADDTLLRVGSGHHVTLDLNGIDIETGSGDYVFEVAEGGSLTLINSSENSAYMIQGEETSLVGLIYNNGTVTIGQDEEHGVYFEDFTFVEKEVLTNNGTMTLAYASFYSCRCDLIRNKGTLTITDGWYKTRTGVVVTSVAPSVTTVNGGYFGGASGGYMNLQGTASVTGGTFGTAYDDDEDVFGDTSTGHIVTGGLFESEVPEKYVAEGYYATGACVDLYGMYSVSATPSYKVTYRNSNTGELIPNIGGTFYRNTSAVIPVTCTVSEGTFLRWRDPYGNTYEGLEKVEFFDDVEITAVVTTGNIYTVRFFVDGEEQLSYRKLFAEGEEVDLGEADGIRPDRNWDGWDTDGDGETDVWGYYDQPIDKNIDFHATYYTVATVTIGSVSTACTDLREAMLTAAGAGAEATVTLEASVTSAGDMDTTGCTNPYGVILNLNGNSIDVESGSFLITGVPLTVTDESSSGEGSISSQAAVTEAGHKGLICNNSSGALTIDGGILEADNISCVLSAGENAASDIIVNAGTVNNIYTAGTAVAVKTGSSDIVINGGTFMGEVLSTSGSCTVNGIRDLQQDGSWKAVAAEITVSYGSEKVSYTELGSRMLYYTGIYREITLKMLCDFTVDSSIDLTTGASDENVRYITWDFNGHTLSSDRILKGIFIINGNSRIDFKDSSEAGNGALKAYTGTLAFIYTTGEGASVTYSSGTFTGAENLQCCGPEGVTGRIIVKSGSFDVNPLPYLLDNYTATHNPVTELYTVVCDSTDLTQITYGGKTISFGSLYEALEYASELSAGTTYVTVRLINNIILKKDLALPVTGLVRLDLNGHSLTTYTGHTESIFEVTGTLWLEDSSSGNTGFITNRYATSDGAVVSVSSIMAGVILDATVKNSHTTGCGGAISSTGGSVTLYPDALIESCSADNKGGAVYLNRLTDSGITVGASMEAMAGSVIKSCSSGLNAGAVYVGPECACRIDTGAEIRTCWCDTASAAQAILVDVAGRPDRLMSGGSTYEAEDDAYGILIPEGEIISLDPEKKDIICYGLLSDADGNLSDIYQQYSAAVVTDYQMTIGTDYTLYFDIQAAFSNADKQALEDGALLSVELSSKSAGTVKSFEELDDGVYRVAIGGLNIAQLENSIGFRLVISGGSVDDREALINTYSTTAADYLESCFLTEQEKSNPSTQLLQVLADTYYLGVQLRQQWEESGGRYAGLPDYMEDYVTSYEPEASDNVTVIRTAVDTDHYEVSGARLTLNERIGLTFIIVTDDAEALVKVTSDEETAAYALSDLTSCEGGYRLELDPLAGYEYDRIYRISVCTSGGETMFVMDYSVNSYLRRMLVSADEEAESTALLRAIYNYGRAVKAYRS